MTGKATKGLTFIELFLVVIIIGIFIGLSAPGFKKTFYSLRLNSFSRQLQTLMHYLSQRAIIEGKVTSLNIDNEKKEYWAKIQDSQTRLKSYAIPEDIKLEIEKLSGQDTADNSQILFYPDGQIEKINIKINLGQQSNILSTEAAFGKVKILSKE